MSEYLQQLNSFEDIVETYKNNVINTCYGFVHQKEDAEDIAQDVFVEIYKSLADFRQEANISTWIYRIAVNKSLDFIKSKNRKKRFAYLQSLFNSKDEPIAISDDAYLNGEENLEIEDHKKALHAALNKLPENQKTAITLNKFEDLNGKEIAEIMELSLSSVEALIHRAKSNLKKYLYRYYEKNLA